MLRNFFGENGIGKRSFFVLAILFLSVFGWFYITLPLLDIILIELGPTDLETLTIWATFYLSIIGTSVLGAYLTTKFSRVKIISSWAIFGAFISLLPAIINTNSFDQVLSVSLFLGASFGIGLPACFAYFADITVVENRGRVGAIVFLIANVIAPFLSILSSSIDLVILSIFFALFRGMGLIVFFFKSGEQSVFPMKKSVSFISIFKDRTFLLYFIAWSMFPLVDNFESVLIVPYLEQNMNYILGLMDIIEPLVGVFSILLAGLLCDWIGRKKIVLSGFVAIGLAYAIIGFFYGSPFSWYVYMVVDALAWGIFSLIFFIVLWGDIAQTNDSGKYYTIGSIPYFLGLMIPALLPESLIGEIELYFAFSLASLFLFVAMMPLAFAPETLPEKKMELRRLRSFAEEARKAREKFENKTK